MGEFGSLSAKQRMTWGDSEWFKGDPKIEALYKAIELGRIST
jgi:hypothetical protein